MEALIEVPQGTRTETGLRQNLRVGIEYLAAWLGGNGCVPLDHLMEDAATAEISRTQVWQWLRYGAALEDGRIIDRPLFDRLLSEEMASLRNGLDPAAHEAKRFEAARALFVELATAERFVEFLTLPAYQRIKTLAA